MFKGYSTPSLLVLPSSHQPQVRVECCNRMHSSVSILWWTQYQILSCNNTAPSAGYRPYSEQKPVASQYQPYEPPKEAPPPYNPSSAPPPYGATQFPRLIQDFVCVVNVYMPQLQLCTCAELKLYSVKFIVIFLTINAIFEAIQCEVHFNCNI